MAVLRGLPKLPVPVGQGVGAQVGSCIHVGLGSAGRAWMVLDLADGRPAWRRLADFPGMLREQALAMAFGPQILVFGGAGYDGIEKRFRAFQDIHCYDTRTDAWTVWPTCSPVPLLGAAIAAAPGGVARFFGGVHDGVFNAFFRTSAGATAGRLDEIVRDYLSMEPADYRYAKAVQEFDPWTDQWTLRSDYAGEPRVGMALAQDGEQVCLLGGETRPGLRSVQAHRLDAHGVGPQVERLADLPGVAGAATPEGVAGAMAGHCGDRLVLVGGTRFPGARGRALQGHRHPHENLRKEWCREIFVLEDSTWRLAGRLPRGLAHAQVFRWNDGPVIVGGEADGGQPRSETNTLTWEDPTNRVT
ncbi:YjhT family mutarotase [Leptothrix sp. BB-4]